MLTRHFDFPRLFFRPPYPLPPRLGLRTAISCLLALVVCLPTSAFSSRASTHASGSARRPFPAEENWSTDMAAATERARKESKDLLLLYTGSDWCPPCKKLESEVLSKAEFIAEASKRFVLVKFDFPRETAQEKNLTDQNKAWAEKFGVASFPTFVLVDRDLRPFAIAGYEEGGLKTFLEMLITSQQLRIDRDEKLTSANDHRGLERARLINEAIGEIRPEIVELYYPEYIAEMVKLDADDELGLRTQWNSEADKEARKVILTDVLMISRLGKPERAIAFIDDVLKKNSFSPKEKLSLLQIKLNLTRQLNDPGRADALLDEMISLDGITPEAREKLLVKKIYWMIGSGRDDEALELLDRSLHRENGSAPNHPRLRLAHGEVLFSKNQPKAAIEAYNGALEHPILDEVVLIALVSAKADALFQIKKTTEAIQTLDQFIDDTQHAAEIRAEALLHKAMLMRDMNRVRQARLAENRAIATAESDPQRSSLQNAVEKLREKFEN